MELIEKMDQFQYWLMDMDDAIANFISLAPSEFKENLDLSPNSLSDLEGILLERYKTPEQTKNSSEAKFLDGAARYFGEVLRVHTGSKWEIRFNDEKFVFYGLPIIYGGKVQAVPICPLTSVTSCTDRRTGNHLLKIFNNLSGPQ